MITDVRVYVDISQKEPELRETALEMLITKAVGQLKSKEAFRNVTVETALDKKAQMIFVDAKDMESMFYYLLENSFEAVDPKNPYIKISSLSEPSLPGQIRVEIFNAGVPLRGGDSEIFSPFFSTKPMGTGFGLSIARLAAIKNYAKLSIKPVPGQGTKAVIMLPLAD